MLTARAMTRAGQPYDIPRAICVHEKDNGARRWRLSGPGA